MFLLALFSAFGACGVIIFVILCSVFLCGSCFCFFFLCSTLGRCCGSFCHNFAVVVCRFGSLCGLSLRSFGLLGLGSLFTGTAAALLLGSLSAFRCIPGCFFCRYSLCCRSICLGRFGSLRLGSRIFLLASALFGGSVAFCCRLCRASLTLGSAGGCAGLGLVVENTVYEFFFFGCVYAFQTHTFGYRLKVKVAHLVKLGDSVH